MNTEQATIRQKELLRKLGVEEIRTKEWVEGLTKEQADKAIKSLIAEANNGHSLQDKDLKQDKYSMGYLSLVKSGCELYKGTGKSLKAVIDEVNNIY